ncbi:MAG: PqqD family protein [Clostridia bacterium]|nr:PqqD family protein [Clostridia bacterium]
MKKQVKENFLDKIPFHKKGLNWSREQDGKVTLEMQNQGIANRLAQLILKKPKISYIHLEEFGSFIWPLIDGKRNILQIGKLVHEHFGDKAEPLYERLSQYFKILEGNGFIVLN